MKEIIDLYREVVIQIATPYSTGTGFFLKDYDIIVTNEHVIKGCRNVVVGGKHFDKQIVSVLYVDPKYDLAFLQAPNIANIPNVTLENEVHLSEGDTVFAIGHPFGLKYTTTQGIVSNLNHFHNDLKYIQHDAALNPGNSGGPLINQRGKIEGVNTFILREGHSIGFALPTNYLLETIVEYQLHKGKIGTRCVSCSNLVFEHTIESSFCQYCGVKIILPNQVDEYEPTGVPKIIENVLKNLGISVELARRGQNMWQFKNGSAKININFNEKSGNIRGDSYLCKLPKDNIKGIYEFLLRENYSAEGFTLSVKGQDIILSILILDRYLNKETATFLFKKLIEQSDYYDDQLITQFSSIKFIEND